MTEFIFAGGTLTSIVVMAKWLLGIIERELDEMRWRHNQSMQLLRLASRRRFATDVKLAQLVRQGVDVNGAFAAAMADFDVEETAILQQEPPSPRTWKSVLETVLRASARTKP
jgi:hypothetical protein